MSSAHKNIELYPKVEASAETRKKRKAEDEKRIFSLKPVEGKHRALVIDPPWDYEWLSLAGRAAPGYATMSQDELLAIHGGGDPAGHRIRDCSERVRRFLTSRQMGPHD